MVRSLVIAPDRVVSHRVALRSLAITCDHLRSPSCVSYWSVKRTSTKSLLSHCNIRSPLKVLRPRRTTSPPPIQDENLSNLAFPGRGPRCLGLALHCVVESWLIVFFVLVGRCPLLALVVGSLVRTVWLILCPVAVPTASPVVASVIWWSPKLIVCSQLPFLFLLTCYLGR